MSRKKADRIDFSQGLDLQQHLDSAKDQWTLRWREWGNMIFSKEHGMGHLVDEAIVKDNHDNFMYCAQTKLKDDETYKWSAWIRPSVCDILGDSQVTTDVLDYYRRYAADAFSRASNAISESVSITSPKIEPTIVA